MGKSSTMKNNRAIYAENYDTDEFEQLICKAHSQSRMTGEIGHKGKTRLSFKCVHCGVVKKSKNYLNMHRLKEKCPGYKGVGRLKMYPVGDQGDRVYFGNVLIKHGSHPARTHRKV